MRSERVTISRRKILAMGGLATLAASLDPLGILRWGHPAVAADAGASTPTLARPGRGLFGGLTTLDQTVVKPTRVDANRHDYLTLSDGNGEPHLIRSDLSSFGYRHPTLSLGAFVQITDLHVVDDQSPARVE